MAESIEELLDRHAELMAHGQSQHAADLAAAAGDEALGALLTLATQIQEVLRPVRPNPAFPARLREGLMAFGAAHVSPGRRVRRYARLVSLAPSRWPRHLARLRHPATRNDLVPLLGKSAAVALVGLATMWWLERSGWPRS